MLQGNIIHATEMEKPYYDVSVTDHDERNNVTGFLSKNCSVPSALLKTINLVFPS